MTFEALSKRVQRQKRECSYVERNFENLSSRAPKNGLSASPKKIQSVRGKNLEISPGGEGGGTENEGGDMSIHGML